MEYVKGEVTYYILLLIHLFQMGYSVPIDYCLQPLNKSDCNVEPTPVFSYYKPGSRCEIELWRGCPTVNKFDSEYECSHFCIAKMFQIQEVSNDLHVPNSTLPSVVTHGAPADPCTSEFNGTQHNEVSIEVYTYRNGTCEKVTWRGFDTLNKFDSESECQKACVKEHLQDWKHKLHKLSHNEVKEIDDILDDIVNETTTFNIKEDDPTTVMNGDLEAVTTEVRAEEITAKITTETVKSEALNLETTTEIPKRTEEIPGDADEVIVT